MVPEADAFISRDIYLRPTQSGKHGTWSQLFHKQRHISEVNSARQAWYLKLMLSSAETYIWGQLSQVSMVPEANSFTSRDIYLRPTQPGKHGTWSWLSQAKTSIWGQHSQASMVPEADFPKQRHLSEANTARQAWYLKLTFPSKDIYLRPTQPGKHGTWSWLSQAETSIWGQHSQASMVPEADFPKQRHLSEANTARQAWYLKLTFPSKDIYLRPTQPGKHGTWSWLSQAKTSIWGQHSQASMVPEADFPKQRHLSEANTARQAWYLKLTFPSKDIYLRPTQSGKHGTWSQLFHKQRHISEANSVR